MSLHGTLNDPSDTDLGYSAKVSLPWDLLGGKPSRGEKLNVHLRCICKTAHKVKSGIVLEDMEGENRDYPGEWLSVKLK